MTNVIFARAAMPSRRLRLLCLLMVAAFCWLAGVALPQTDGDGMSRQDSSEILRYALEMNRANYEKLRTWTAKLNYTQNASGDRFKAFFTDRTIKGSVDIAIDMETDSFRWNLSRSLTRTNADSVVSEDTRRQFTAGLAVADEFYRVGPEATERIDRKRTYALRERRGYSFSTDDFRPHLTCFFGETLGSTGMFYDHVGSYVKQASEGTLDGSIRVDGDLVILRTRPDADPYRGNEYVFDLSKGGNLVKWYASDGPGDVGEDLMDYAEHNGVWVPVSYKRRSIRGDAYIEDVEYVFESHEVNAPLSPDEFTLAAIEGRPGDEIYDNRTRTRYSYQPDGSLAKKALEMPPGAVDFLVAMPEEEAPMLEAEQANVPEVVRVESQAESPVEAPAEPESLYLPAVLILLVSACALGVLYLMRRKRRR